MTSTNDYPNYCHYCTTKFKVAKCLLPYAIAANVMLPEDSNDKMMQLTELHCSFDVFALGEIARTAKIQLSQYSDPETGAINRINNWTVHNPSLPPSSLVSNGASTVASESIDLRSTDHESLPEAHSTADPTETATPTVVDPPNGGVPVEFNEGKAFNMPPPKMDFTSPNVIHFVNDTALAAITAQNLRKLNRDNTKLSDLTEALKKELLLLEGFQDEYRPHTSTELNHVIALARELVANHSHEELNNWKHCHANSSRPPTGCLLTYLVSPENHSITKPDNRLDNALLLFSRHFVYTIPKLTNQKKTFAERSLKALLSEREMRPTYDWLRTTPSYKIIKGDPELQSLIKPESRAHKAISTSKSLKPLPPHLEELPPLPDKTSKLLEEHLTPIILSFVQGPDYTSISAINTESTLEYLHQMTDRLVRFNPHWERSAFSVSIPMVDQCLRGTRTPLATFDKLALSSNLTGILNVLRPPNT